MKHKLLNPVFTFILGCFSLASNAQREDREGGRVESLHIAYITEKLQLTPAEAQAFWPIFNEFQAKLKEIRRQRRMGGLDAKASDADLEKAAIADFDAEERINALKKDLFVQLKKVLPMRKILKLIRAEREFKTHLLDFLRDGRRNEPDDEPPPLRPRGRR